MDATTAVQLVFLFFRICNTRQGHHWSPDLRDHYLYKVRLTADKERFQTLFQGAVIFSSVQYCFTSVEKKEFNLVIMLRNLNLCICASWGALDTFLGLAQPLGEEGGFNTLK